MSGELLAVTDRDRAIVREIARFGVMSRAQLMRSKFFASKTRANARTPGIATTRFASLPKAASAATARSASTSARRPSGKITFESTDVQVAEMSCVGCSGMDSYVVSVILTFCLGRQ